MRDVCLWGQPPKWKEWSLYLAGLALAGLQAWNVLERYILVVDDEAGIRLLLTELFERSGTRVQAIGSGEEAVRLVRQNTAPFIILLDMKMPGMDGLETLRQLREAGVQAPCLLMTAVTGDQRVQRAMKLGPISILPKPFDVLALRNRVDTLCSVV